MDDTRSRTWAEISTDNLEHNYRALRGLTPPGCRFMGVVKANAYGHGAVEIARRLEALGADYFGAATLDEAVALRDSGISKPILIFGYTPPEYAETLCRLNLTQTVFDVETARFLSQNAPEPLNIHIKVDTGMSRLGFCGASAAEEIAAVCSLPKLRAEGIYTHFASADSDAAYTNGQFGAFQALLGALAAAGCTFPIRHAAGSAAMLSYPETHLDMVRPGIALYGYLPAASDLALRPVMTLKTRVCSVKRLPAGTKIGYGGTHALLRDSTVAVLPIGYADGLPRLLSNRGTVLIGGARAPIVGRVCMDLCMVDVTDFAVRVGDEAVVFGDNLPLAEKADAVGTIVYELLCAVSARVPRVAGQPTDRIY